MAGHFSVRKAVTAIFGLAIAAYALPDQDSSASASDANNPTYKSDTTFQKEMMNSTNTYRAMYGASSVTWNSTLATYAQNAANGCVFEHTGGPYGENIAEGYQSTTNTCQAWGDERLIYSWSSPGFSEATGHFTQLVWKNSAQVGCGRSFCGSSKGWYVVCEYYPVGNVEGNYQQEVGTLVPGVTAAATSAAVTPTTTSVLAMQTVSTTAAALPFFTNAAERREGAGRGVNMAMVGLVGALAAWG